SAITSSVKGREQTIDITNVRYEVAGQGVFGRPRDERLVLRMNTATKQVIDEIGITASTTVEAWPMGSDLKQKPIYAGKVQGIEPVIINNELLKIARGLEETEWWSLYKLGSGQHLFYSYVAPASFSISREILTLRYVGLDVPPDNSPDGRLKAPNVIAVLT